MIKELLSFEKNVSENIVSIVDSTNETLDLSMDVIEKMIDRDFERYDEVFRALA